MIIFLWHQIAQQHDQLPDEQRDELDAARRAPPEVRLVRHEPVRRPRHSDPLLGDRGERIEPAVHAAAERVAVQRRFDGGADGRGRARQPGAIVAQVPGGGPGEARRHAVPEEALVHRRNEAAAEVHGHQVVVGGGGVRGFGARDGRPHERRHGQEGAWMCGERFARGFTRWIAPAPRTNLLRRWSSGVRNDGGLACSIIVRT
jgi:hypothetical protein